MSVCLYLFYELHRNIRLSSFICTMSLNKEFWYPAVVLRLKVCQHEVVSL